MEAGFFSAEGEGGIVSPMRVRSFSSASGGVGMERWERGLAGCFNGTVAGRSGRAGFARPELEGAKLACKGSETVDERWGGM